MFLKPYPTSPVPVRLDYFLGRHLSGILEISDPGKLAKNKQKNKQKKNESGIFKLKQGIAGQFSRLQGRHRKPKRNRRERGNSRYPTKIPRTDTIMCTTAVSGLSFSHPTRTTDGIMGHSVCRSNLPLCTYCLESSNCCQRPTTHIFSRNMRLAAGNESYAVGQSPSQNLSNEGIGGLRQHRLLSSRETRFL